MEFQTVRALRGPNIWAKSGVLEVIVDVERFSQRRPQEVPGLFDRLTAWIPTLDGSSCAQPENKPTKTLCRQSVTWAHLLERITVELQTLAGSGTGFGRTHEIGTSGSHQVLVGFTEESVVRKALGDACALCRTAIEGKAFDITETIDELRSLDQQIRLGPSTGSIVRAAEARGIPTRRLNEGSLVQLGFGARQHRILAAETDRTSAIAETIAQDKELTKTLLRAIGVPVPEGRPVTSAEDAWEAAQDIGGPVVVKPQYGNHGRGVAVNLTTQEQVLAAFDAAKDEGTSVIVEGFAPGSDHRMFVVGDKLVAAARREPPQVTGNGKDTIAQLVEEINRDPRRGEDHATPLSKLCLDAIALAVLAELELTPESVLPEGKVVAIRRNANLSTGGSAVDVTDIVHPEVAARAVDAARVVGLDVAGVDVVAVDVSRPLEEQGGVIVEVNAGPGLRMHLEPSEGKPRAVGEAIVATIFPEGDDGRVPVVAVTGDCGTGTTTRLIAHILRGTGGRVGHACTEGVFVNEHQADARDCSGAQGAQLTLLNPQVEAAVLELSGHGILTEGLGFDRCSVAVITDRGSRIDAATQTAIQRIVTESVLEKGVCVLNAQDPQIAGLAAHCLGQILLFAVDSDSPAVIAHRNRDGRVAFVRDGAVILAQGQREIRIGCLNELPPTQGEHGSQQIEAVLAAAAAAWAVGITEESIRTGLQTFRFDTARQAPGTNGWAPHAQNGADANGHAGKPLASPESSSIPA